MKLKLRAVAAAVALVCIAIHIQRRFSELESELSFLADKGKVNHDRHLAGKRPHSWCSARTAFLVL